MIRLADKEPLYLELYEALAHFVGQQQLVVQAVIDQGVQPEKLVGVSGWYDKTPQRGEWGKNWRFFFHGGGCCITHVTTGEPVDWDGPDPLAFDPFFFIHHLEWRLEHESGLPLLRTYIERRGTSLAVADLIKDLINDGIISPAYHLVPTAVIAAKDAA